MAEFASQRRPGVPDTVNIGPTELGTFFGPLPGWYGPILGLWQQQLMSTDDLCASAPPAAESWSLADLLGALDETTRPFIAAKLRRMTIAAMWPTYCEFAPAAEGETNARVRYLGASFLNLEVKQGDSAITRAVVWPDADFYVYSYQLIVPPTPHAPGNNQSTGAALWWGYQGQGAIGMVQKEATTELLRHEILVAGMATHAGAAVAGETNAQFLARTALRTDGVWIVWWDDYGGEFTGSNPGAGRSVHSLTAWALDGVPRVPEWPAIPSTPVFQFTDQAVADLTLMGAEWPTHRIGGAILPGMIMDVYAAVQNWQPGTTAPGVTSEIGPELVSGANWVPIPPGTVGIGVECYVPQSWSQSGDAARINWDMGYITVGGMDGWHPSQRLKHQAQLWHPLPPGVTTAGVDLSVGVTGVIHWLRPSVTPQ